MSIVFKTAAALPTSLRAGQQDAIRTRIVEVGISLFFERGFDATSVDMIALDAGVSRRTVFRHFSTKEQIVLAWSRATADALSAEVCRRSANEPPVACLCNVLLDYVAAHTDQHPAALSIGRLIEATPSLRAHNAEKYALWERVLAEALVLRGGVNDRVAAIAAAVTVSVFRVGAQAWINGGGNELLVDLLTAHFSALNSLQRQSSQIFQPEP